MKHFANILIVAFIAVAGLSAIPVNADTKPCPPGLAKKNPPCVPPGQAKKGVTADDWQDRNRIGEIIDDDDFTYLDDYLRYDLPRLPAGQRYAIVDDRIVVIDNETYRILQLIRVLTSLD
jgi:hypothetical protein